MVARTVHAAQPDESKASTPSRAQLLGPLGPRLTRALVFTIGACPAAFLLVMAVARRWVDDDGFINLRIVRNLLEGNGPVFNVGERVEAATSTLWIFVIAALGSLGVRLEHAAVYAGIALTVSAMILGQIGALVTMRRSGAPPSSLWEQWPVPLGSAVYAALPPAWDYASSGLETGLSLFWLSACHWSLIRAGRRGMTRRTACVVSAWVGLGPLIRPDLAVYSVAFFAAAVWGLSRRARGLVDDAERESRLTTVLAGLALMLVSAGAVPVGYQVFRMGYYGALTPNPALAKEAFAMNATQGLAYVRNFTHTYYATIPLACVLLAIIVRLARARRSGPPLVWAAGGAACAGALLQAGYIVLVGGDYMHGRMLLPPVFAMSLPVSMVALRDGAPSRALTPRWRSFLAPAYTWVRSAAVAGVLAWAVVCAGLFRVSPENESQIGDERGWYARQAQVDNPVLVDDYRAFEFHRDAARHLEMARARCAMSDGPPPDRSSCPRELHLDDDRQSVFVPSAEAAALGPAVSPKISYATSYGAIGIAGYVLPSWVFLADRFGLADPIGARLEVHQRGRPGHEKPIKNAWLAARLSAPMPGEDASIAAARRTIACGPMRRLMDAVSAPVSAQRFLQNIGDAADLQKLRIPSDPFDAEVKFCGVARTKTTHAIGGPGGGAFRWECPSGTRLVGLSGSLQDKEQHVAEVAAECADFGSEDLKTSPSIGARTEHRYRLTCAHGEQVVGLHGRSDRFIAQLGIVCAHASTGDAEPHPTRAVGYERLGTEFRFGCGVGRAAVGIIGRVGQLVDSLGLVCESVDASTVPAKSVEQAD